MANYVNAVRTGNLLFLSGKGPGLPAATAAGGKVGRDITGRRPTSTRARPA